MPSRLLLLTLIVFSLGVKAGTSCREDGSTMEMRACIVDELKVEEEKLSEALNTALKSSDWIAKEINRSQEDWIKYRDTQCNAVYSLGGSMRFISQPLCLLDLTKQRTIGVLKSFTRDTDYGGN